VGLFLFRKVLFYFFGKRAYVKPHPVFARAPLVRKVPRSSARRDGPQAPASMVTRMCPCAAATSRMYQCMIQIVSESCMPSPRPIGSPAIARDLAMFNLGRATVRNRRPSRRGVRIDGTNQPAKHATGFPALVHFCCGDKLVNHTRLSGVGTHYLLGERFHLIMHH
jgi:hypothetical protein